jgi:hypothetical protein
MRAAYPWVQVDGGRWTPFRTTVDVLRGSRVQFALRIDDFLDQSSPFAYSPVYVAS